MGGQNLIIRFALKFYFSPLFWAFASSPLKNEPGLIPGAIFFFVTSTVNDLSCVRFEKKNSLLFSVVQSLVQVCPRAFKSKLHRTCPPFSKKINTNLVQSVEFSRSFCGDFSEFCYLQRKHSFAARAVVRRVGRAKNNGSLCCFAGTSSIFG